MGIQDLCQDEFLEQPVDDPFPARPEIGGQLGRSGDRNWEAKWLYLLMGPLMKAGKKMM